MPRIQQNQVGHRGKPDGRGCLVCGQEGNQAEGERR